MEWGQTDSSPEKSPSDERRHRNRPRTPTGGIEDVVSGASYSLNVPGEETRVVIGNIAGSSPLTPTRPRIGEQGGAPENVRGGSQEASGRKRGRTDDQGGSGSGGQKGKKKGELTDPPSTEPKCATCGKTFGSWKAVFGHLRSHPDREYRGAFPPPKIWEEMLQQEAARHQQAQDEGGIEMGALDAQQQQDLLASTLLNVARDVSSKLFVGGNIEGESSQTTGRESAAAVSPPSSRGLEIDLNYPKEPESPSRKGVFPFDLNMPAPESDEDDSNNES